MIMGFSCPGRCPELRESRLQSGFSGGWNDRWCGDGPAGGLGEGRHAQVHGGGLAGGEFVHLGELGGCGGEADFESFGFAGPAVLLGLGDAVAEVVADAGQAGALGWVGPQEGAADAPLTELTGAGLAMGPAQLIATEELTQLFRDPGRHSV
jgi:hypothetical protein